MKAEAETGVKLPQAKEYLETLETRKGQRRTLPWRRQGSTALPTI